MSQDNLTKMACTACKKVNYHTKKNKRIKVRLELNKLCPHCKKRTLHKESK